MSKRTITFLLIITTLVLAVVAVPVLARPAMQTGVVCEESYTVQAGDWLSMVAEKYYGEPLAYTALVDATNIAARTDSTYQPITDPATVEAEQVLCILSAEEAAALLERQAVLGDHPRVERGKGLLIVTNRSLEEQPATLTLAGGEFGEGEEIILEPGQEIDLQLAPGDYEASWTLPVGTAGRRFEIVANVAKIVELVPENAQMYAEHEWAGSLAGAPRGESELGHVHLPSVQTTESPYSLPEGEALLVAGHRTFDGIYSLVGLTGGRFGEGEGYLLNPEQETVLLIEPGTYQVIWMADDRAANSAILQRGEVTVEAGQVIVTWLMTAEQRAYVQPVGEPGFALDSFWPPSETDVPLLLRLVETAGIN